MTNNNWPRATWMGTAEWRQAWPTHPLPIFSPPQDLSRFVQLYAGQINKCRSIWEVILFVTLLLSTVQSTAKQYYLGQAEKKYQRERLTVAIDRAGQFIDDVNPFVPSTDTTNVFKIQFPRELVCSRPRNGGELNRMIHVLGGVIAIRSCIFFMPNATNVCHRRLLTNSRSEHSSNYCMLSR